jgi:GntR family transcriptional regulator/MocR family aminotransferase
MANQEAQEWANSAVPHPDGGVDLLLELHHGGGFRVGLEQALREAIRSGRLARGARLPPTRALARDLGLSRGTVLEAYGQLAAEGWIAARQGSSTVVAFDVEREGLVRAMRERQPTRWRFDLRPGRPDAGAFPRGAWMRALRRALATAPGHAFDYGDPRGDHALRSELAGYLSRARGLRVAAADLVVTTGFTQGLGLFARALAAAGARCVAMEEPSMALHRAIVRGAGHELFPLPVDEDGAHVEALEGREVGAVVLTPNRQHPTGATLAPNRRAWLLDWARATGAHVLEDDYDGEFRYDRRPIGPLQGLDPTVVVYGGTASKTLAPGVRLGWLAVPEPLRALVIAQKQCADWGTSALEQLALTELMRTTAYDRHVRAMRLRYRRRRDTLLRALAVSAPQLDVLGAAAGLNVLIPLRDQHAEAEAIAAANAAGVGLDGLAAGGYYERYPAAGLIVGYAAAPEHSFQRAIAALAEALKGVRPMARPGSRSSPPTALSVPRSATRPPAASAGGGVTSARRDRPSGRRRGTRSRPG